MTDEASPFNMLKSIVKMAERKEYTRAELDKDKVWIMKELQRLPKDSPTCTKAMLIQITRDMRNLKMTVRRLTQTELVQNEVKGGRLNDSFIEALRPA